MHNSFKQGDLHPTTFGEVIDRAIGRREEENRCSVAERWHSTPESLYRWQNNAHQSPKFIDLVEIVKHMSPAERIDVAHVLFGRHAAEVGQGIDNQATVQNPNLDLVKVAASEVSNAVKKLEGILIAAG